MESHSRGLRLRTARPIRFPGTPSPKGTSFRDESVENSTAGYSKTSMREFYTVSAARFRNADRPACAPDPPCVRDISGPSCGDRHPRRLRHRRPRSLQSRQTIRGNALCNGFRTAGNEMPARVVPIQPYLDTLRPENCPTRKPPALRRQKTSGPGIFAESRKAFRIRARPKGRPNDREPSGSKARAASVLSARPVTSAVSSHSENNAGRIPRPADTRPSPNRTAYPYRSRRARHNARGPHQRRELAGRHRLLGRRERAAPAALDLDDMEHALAQSHDVEFVTPAAPISMQQLEPVGNKPFGRRLLAPQARLARLHG